MAALGEVAAVVVGAVTGAGGGTYFVHLVVQLPAAIVAGAAIGAADATAAQAAGGLHAPEVVLLLSGLLLVAAVAAVWLRRVRLPFTAALVVLGIGLQLLSQAPLFEGVGSLRLSAELTLFVLVPALLFEAAFNIDSRRLLENLGPILVLAVPVVLVSTAVVGVLLGTFGGLALPVALVFGALISATDPVAVLAIFKEVGAPKRLSLLVDGESLMNDGTALVFFQLLLGLALAGASGLEVLPAAAVEFVRVTVGGVMVGLAAGWLCAQVIGRIDHEPVVELTLSLVLAYGTFALADHVLRVSGVIATVVAALTLGNYGRTKITPAVLPRMEHFWEYLAFVANALIFLLVGLSLDLGRLSGLGGLLLLAIGAVLLGRALPIFALIPLTNRLIRESIPRTYQVVLFWGGLRGALALALALSLPATFPARQAFIDLAFGVVLFTLLVGGPTTGPLLRRLGLMQESQEEVIERQTGLALVAQVVESKLARLREEGTISEQIVDELAAQLHASEAALQEELQAARAREGFTRAEEERLIRRHALLLEKQAALALFEEGDITEGTLKELQHRTQRALDALRWEEEEAAHGGRANHEPWWERLAHVLIRALVEHTRWTRRLQSWAQFRSHLWRTHRLEREYECRRARCLILDAVLRELAEMEAAHVSDEAVRAVEAWYRMEREAAQQGLAELTAAHHAYAEHAQRVIARRFYLRTEQQALAALHEGGLISERVLREAVDEIERELRQLRREHVETQRAAPVAAGVS